MADPVVVSIEREGNHVTVTGAGALDFTNAQEFQAGLKDAAGTADSVTVDLRPATFIDTAILQYLASAAKVLRSRGKRLKVVVADDSHPLHVLKIVGFAELMDIEAAPEDS